jgi:hypothetical protein
MAEVHMPHAAHDDGDHNAGIHHETTDVNISAIILSGVALIVSAVLISFVVWVLFKYFESREARRVAPEYPLAATQEVRVPPEPRLQTDPRQDLQDLRAQENQILNSYGWIDKNTGVVRIPIDEAMKLVVQRGLPSRQQANDRR